MLARRRAVRSRSDCESRTGLYCASNASAAFQFLNYAQRNRLGTIVGQPTGGNRQGINGGNYFFLSLPNSKIEIDLPVYFFAPTDAQKDEGVIPDVPVKRRADDIGNDRHHLVE